MRSKFFFSFSFVLLALFVLIINASAPLSNKRVILNTLTKVPRIAFSTSYLEEKRLSPQTVALQKMDFVYAK